jgi:hypothetical protein
VGFEFIKEYITIPGFLNFEQPVRLWQLTLERFTALQSALSEASFNFKEKKFQPVVRNFTA